MTTVATMFWQRLDTAGHDACRLERLADGWRLAGTAVFDHAGEPCALAYVVDCDAQWQTRSARVDGWRGAAEVAIAVARTGDWTLNGTVQPQPRGCVDLDLGFTPATNLLPLRRLDLAVGDTAAAPAAYLDIPQRELTRLDQSYERTGEAAYAYRAPAYGYAATLTVAPAGFVTDYPGLWRAATATQR